MSIYKVFKEYLVYYVISLFFMSPASAEVQVEMLVVNAIVVDQACSLREGDENIDVDFGDVLNKDLLRNHRTRGKKFQLHLDKCEPALSNGVNVTFTGEADSDDSFLLVSDGDGKSKGFGIGLEHNGLPLPFNKPSSVIPLTYGSNVLDFVAYLQLLPSAGNVPIIGEFSTTAKFVLNYE